MPQSGHASIRACFSERDMKQRADACHDEYTFDATLTLSGTSAAGMPVLRYRSKATSLPGRVSRSKDSLGAQPLRQRDLVTVTDPQCSYQRLYRFSRRLALMCPMHQRPTARTTPCPEQRSAARRRLPPGAMQRVKSEERQTASHELVK